MNKQTFSVIEKYMRKCMNDGAHDEQHIYRVLYSALDIASQYVVNMDVILAAALLHDIGRESQLHDSKLDHAIVGSEMAYEYLKGMKWSEENAQHVKDCIRTHRYRNNEEPKTIEAKILYDADKLDATGTLGIARTIAYKGIVSEPLYSIDEFGNVLDGSIDSSPSFFQEYNWKLKKIYENFYTNKAAQIAEARRKASIDFYQSMLEEVKHTHIIGKERLGSVLQEK